MKKGTIAAVTGSVLLIIVLIGFAVFLKINFGDRTGVSGEADTQTQLEAEEVLMELNEVLSGMSEISQDFSGGSANSSTNSATDSTSASAQNDAATTSAIAAGSTDSVEKESETEPDTEWVLELLVIEDEPVIWVGDSRTVGMQKALGVYTDDVFIGEAGEGYPWLAETGMPLLKEAIASYPDRPVIFNMGVNDYENLSNYLELYAELTTEYPSTVFCFLSVNPVDDEAGLYITNEKIEDFNAHLKSAYPDTYLDSYTYLTETDTETIDGIHYAAEDYRRIYLFVKNMLSTSASSGES